MIWSKDPSCNDCYQTDIHPYPHRGYEIAGQMTFALVFFSTTGAMCYVSYLSIMQEHFLGTCFFGFFSSILLYGSVRCFIELVQVYVLGQTLYVFQSSKADVVHVHGSDPRGSGQNDFEISLTQSNWDEFLRHTVMLKIKLGGIPGRRPEAIGTLAERLNMQIKCNWSGSRVLLIYEKDGHEFLEHAGFQRQRSLGSMLWHISESNQKALIVH